ncbi:MAG: hypothetical protein R3B71_04085 [Candidatus Gracilibacteria bacterium]
MKKLIKHEIEFLIKTLQDGKEIPPDYKYALFPTTQKEYELVYAGKMRKERFTREGGWCISCSAPSGKGV